MEEQKYLLDKRAEHVSNVHNMRLSGKFCDVVIKVKDAEFQAHKVILAGSLKYFESKLNRLGKHKQDVIKMIDLKSRDLEPFLLFAYTGQLLLTNSNVLQILQTANYLSEEGVKKACIEYLTSYMKEQEACGFYRMAKAIECSSLKNAAKTTVLRNFKTCSQTLEFLQFDCESLKDILKEAVKTFTVLPEILLGGIIKWILHNMHSRVDYIYNLLDIMQLDQLDSECVLQYDKSMKNQGSSFDLMSFYHKKIHQKEHETQLNSNNLIQSLMLIGDIKGKVSAQFYNFIEKKWSQLYKITYSKDCHMAAGFGVIFNDIFYNLVIQRYSKNNDIMHLAGFSISMKQNRILSSDSRLLRIGIFRIFIFIEVVPCVRTKFIYFCGGETTKFSNVMNQLLRYDPKTECLENLPGMKTKRLGAQAIFYQGSLYVFGGYDQSSKLHDTVEKYDPDTKEWSTLESISLSREGFGLAVLNDKLYIGGGKQPNAGWTNSVEVYDPSMNSLQSVAHMKSKRFPMHMVTYEEKLLAIGGDTARTIEVYDPKKNQWQIDDELFSTVPMTYLKSGLVPSCCAFCAR